MKSDAMLLDVLIGVLVIGAAAAIGFASLDPGPAVPSRSREVAFVE